MTDEKSKVVELSETSIESLAQSLRQMLISEHQSTDVLCSISTVRAEERRQAVSITKIELKESSNEHSSRPLGAAFNSFNIHQTLHVQPKLWRLNRQPTMPGTLHRCWGLTSSVRASTDKMCQQTTP